MAGVAVPGAQQAPPQNEPRPVFKASVARVSLAATVRDRRGRPVTTLKIDDFHLFDNGQPAKILEFSRAQAPVGIALLADVSGSMDVAEKRAASKRDCSPAAGVAQAGRRSHRPVRVRQDAGRGSAAASRAGRRPQAHGRRWSPTERRACSTPLRKPASAWLVTAGPRRAVVVLTDGDDNASRMTAEQVSAIASSIDVPVYVIVVVSPFDRTGRAARP